jgi:HD-GYP domain-containing protein (c-di-GMP phosphodiesterase class II)
MLMSAQAKDERLYGFYRDLCVSFVGVIRALSLYPEDHPETEKKFNGFFQRVSKFLEQRSTLSLIFVGREIVVENTPLPELSNTLAKFIGRMEDMKLQRITFRRGLTSEEFIRFLRLLLPLLKNPSDADLIISKNQEALPHMLAGSLPYETGGPELSHDEIASALQAANQSALSFAGQLKDMFADLEGPLSEAKVTMAKEITDTVYRTVVTGEMPLKVLILRRSSDPDPHIHAINVSALSMALAQKLDLKKEETILQVGLAGLLHDIGLHSSPSISLTKTSTLTLDEKKLQYVHPVRGAEILLSSPGMPELVPIVAYEHHLQYNGGGYPKQESPRQLNMASMITFITNSYDNLRRNRTKRKALSLTDAINWMDRKAGEIFHPLILKRFRALVKTQAQEVL